MPLISKLVTLISSQSSNNKLLYSVDSMKYSYQDMLNRVSQIQQFFLKNSNARDNIVVTGHKEFDMYCSAIACILTNRRFVPVDCSLDHTRLATIVEICQPALILNSTNETCSFTGATNSNEITIPVDKVSIEHLPGSDDIAYIIFTSGTTGTPKGVQVSIEALEDFLNWTTSTFFHFSDHEVFVNHALYSFDLSVFELWTALVTNNAVVSLTHTNNANPRKNIKQLAENNASCFVSTPSFVELTMIDWKFNSENLPSIKSFVFCGEILNKSTVRALMERFPNAKIFNLYGPTEATCATTGSIVSEDDLNSEGFLSVGVVKPDTNIFIDSNNQEVIVCGPNVAHGYLNTSSDAFFEHNGKRAYRTGDAGYYDEKGQLYISGRIDRQIKFNGYRIELDEIEYHLNQNESDQVAVIANNVDGKVTAIYAFAIAKEPFSLEDLNKKLEGKLPAYMKPTKLITLPSMPLNANGKVDRKKLQAMLEK